MAIDTALLSQLGILKNPGSSGNSSVGSSGTASAGTASGPGSAVKSTGTLGQQDFLKLMVTQLQNQDPFKPMDSGQFLSQMAQFGTVSGIGDLQNSFKQLSSSLTSNQGLQASSLVGHEVAVPSAQGVLPAQGSMKAAVDVPSATSQVSVDITDGTGQIIKHMDLGPQASGLSQFSWDGTTDSGTRATAGQYTIKATANIGGQQTALNSYAVDTVNSVTLNNNGTGPSLSLSALGQVDLSQVKQFL